uniref:Uncharacterized protein n=1 Tax=Arundo donax TaxID=35708 RepID=A0A0A9GFR8_ARUDO
MVGLEVVGTVMWLGSCGLYGYLPSCDKCLLLIFDIIMIVISKLPIRGADYRGNVAKISKNFKN